VPITRNIARSVGEPPAARPARITSIDALRAFVMFMMLFVNDLSSAGKMVPDWMVHFSDRHPGGSGMTFVDLVFPAFLFIVGMSIPFAPGGRLGKGEPRWKVFGHVAARSVSLVAIGILMVHGTPESAALGWSGDWWCVLMYLAAMAAFSLFGTRRLDPKAGWDALRVINATVRVIGIVALVWLAFAFRGANGQRIITLAPFSIDAEWYGILGLIGWAYFVAAIVFLVCRGNRTAILGCMMLLMCLFVADRQGAFEGFWLSNVLEIGEVVGSQAAIVVGGLLLGSMLAAPDMSAPKARAKFTFWFAAGCAAAALLMVRPWGISKNDATPAWCFWACAVTAALWYGFYLVCDVHPVKIISRPLALAGQNVLLAYLISEMLPSVGSALRVDESYDHLATGLASGIARAALCGVIILLLSTGLNCLGFRLKL
jgi:heparan-alpha-glucosaminide N-acetyltransferase